MQWIFSIIIIFLFFISTPDILVKLPPKAGKITVAVFHAIVFALILHFTFNTFSQNSSEINENIDKEGFKEGVDTIQNNVGILHRVINELNILPSYQPRNGNTPESGSAILTEIKKILNNKQILQNVYNEINSHSSGTITQDLTPLTYQFLNELKGLAGL